MSVRAACLVGVGVCLAGAATVQAGWLQTRAWGGWTGVAATGTIDEADLSKIVLNNDGSAGIRPTITSTSAKLRFQVPEAEALLQRDPGSGGEVGSLVFMMRVRDNGPGARVIATLRRVWLGYFVSRPEQSDVAATIDSDRFPPSDGWMTVAAQQYSSCCWIRNPNYGGREGLDFFDAAYFVEVQLIKNNAEGTPGIWSVAITRTEP